MRSEESGMKLGNMTKITRRVIKVTAPAMNYTAATINRSAEVAAGAFLNCLIYVSAFFIFVFPFGVVATALHQVPPTRIDYSGGVLGLIILMDIVAVKLVYNIFHRRESFREFRSIYVGYLLFCGVVTAMNIHRLSAIVAVFRD